MAAPIVAPLPKTPAKPRGRPKKSNAEASASASTPSHSSPPQTHSRPRLMSNPSAPALPPRMLHVTQFLFTYLGAVFEIHLATVLLTSRTQTLKETHYPTKLMLTLI